MRLIDANALKRAINKDKALRQYLDCGHAKSWLMQTIDEQPTIQPEQCWIPVAERLPKERYYNDSDYVEPSDSVLVFTRYKTYYISRYWGHRTTKGESNYVIPDWMDLDEYISDAVIAWTPLPEEYRG